MKKLIMQKHMFVKKKNLDGLDNYSTTVLALLGMENSLQKNQLELVKGEAHILVGR